MDEAHTLTALYRERASAERAVERLHALGVPEHRISLQPGDGGDVLPGETMVAGGLLGSLQSLMEPESDAPAPSSTVLVANHVPAEQVASARAALAEEAVEVDDVGPAG